MSQKPCEYVVGAYKVGGRELGFKECGKMTSHRSKKSSRWWWKRTPICFHHLQFSTLPPREWI